MTLTHDARLALAAATALVNSGLEPATITTSADLDAFFDQWEYTGRHDRDAAEFAQIIGLRPRLRELLLADRDDAPALINAMLAEAKALPQLVRHEGFDWHIHASGPDAPWADRILVETAMAMIDLIRADELSRLAVCADETCEGVVLDLSRNRSRIYCSTACSNRHAVAAYRARQAGRD